MTLRPPVQIGRDGPFRLIMTFCCWQKFPACRRPASVAALVVANLSFTGVAAGDRSWSGASPRSTSASLEKRAKLSGSLWSAGGRKDAQDI
jgi:hypothetical protein